MYTKFFGYFGLRTNPFQVCADGDCLYLNQKTQAALEGMAGAIQARKGLIVLTGEVGTGKTTLVNELKLWLADQRIPTAFIFNPFLEPNDLYELILGNFGVRAEEGRGENTAHRLQRWLAEQFQASGNAVVILDEAQGLPVPLLLEISMLLNYETAGQKLLQIVLVGGPELEEKLKFPQLRQIRQRISFRCQTGALTREEAHEYVSQKVRAAGGTSENAISAEAIDAAYLHSGGIPRVMNLLCEHAMIQGFLQQAKPVPSSIVDEVARQLQFDAVQVSDRSIWYEEPPVKAAPAAPRTWSGSVRRATAREEKQERPPDGGAREPSAAARAVATAAGTVGAARNISVAASQPAETSANASPAPVQASRLETQAAPIQIPHAQIERARMTVRSGTSLGSAASAGVVMRRGWSRQRVTPGASLAQTVRKARERERELRASLITARKSFSGELRNHVSRVRMRANRRELALMVERLKRSSLADSARRISEALSGWLERMNMRARQRKLGLLAERSKRMHLGNAPRRISEEFERISALAIPASLHRNWSWLVRWLQQPVPFLKIHRRAGD